MTRLRNRSPYSPRISQTRKKNQSSVLVPITKRSKTTSSLNSLAQTASSTSPAYLKSPENSPMSSEDSMHDIQNSPTSSPERDPTIDLFGVSKNLGLKIGTERNRSNQTGKSSSPGKSKSPVSVRSPARSPSSPGSRIRSSTIPKLDTSILTAPIFYTESQYKEFNGFKATEYQILKEDRYAKEKHLYNEKQLEPTFLKLLLENQDEEGVLSDIQNQMKEIKFKVKEVEKELKTHKQNNAPYFKGPGLRPEKIFPEIIQNKQQLDFLKDLNAKYERLKNATTELTNRMQQIQEDSKVNVSKLDEGLIREMMLARSLSLLPKIEKIVDIPKGDEIKVECRLHEYSRSTFSLVLTFDRMGGQLTRALIYRIENDKKINVTHKYQDLVSFSIRKNDIEFLVGELNASVDDEI